MRDADNENFPLTFSKLGLAAALIVNRLRVEAQLLETTTQKERDSRDGDRSNPEKNKESEQRDYINQRLKELASFERRANGK